MVRELTSSLTAALLLVGCQASNHVSVDQLVERHTESRGGKQAIENVHSLRFILEITEMDKASFLITRILDTSALHPDLDKTKSRTETRYTDFEAFGGVLYARLTEKIDTASARVVQTVMVKEVHINPTIDPATFVRPGE